MKNQLTKESLRKRLWLFSHLALKRLTQNEEDIQFSQDQSTSTSWIKITEKMPFSFYIYPQKTRCSKITEKVSLKIPSHIYILRGQKLIKITQNSVTRQFNFNWTKIGGNFQNWKMQKRHFWQFLNIAKTHIFSIFVLKILINEWEFYVWFSTTVLTKRQKFCL